MVNRITDYIADLLYTHDRVIIPDFGAFVSDYKSSSIDHVQGLLYPPSKQLSFNENLLVNDGLLFNYIRQQEDCSQTAAHNRLDAFLEEVQKALQNREIVVFPRVGRLYLDYEQKMQFLPDSVNFNTQVYGLPTVQYYPILRSRTSSQEDAATPATPILTDKRQYVIEKAKREQSWAQYLRPAVPYILTGVLVAAGVFGYQKLRDSKLVNTGDLPPMHLPTSNINTSPSKNTMPYIEEIQPLDEDEVDAMPLEEESVSDKYLEDSEQKYVEKAVEKDEIIPSEKKVVRKTEAEPGDIEGATLRPEQPYAVIIVHAFGNQDNVRRMMKNLQEKGYQPYKDSYKELTRVGIQLMYDDAEQLNITLQKIRRSMNKGAYVLEQSTLNQTQ